jgi:hypothetical protein
MTLDRAKIVSKVATAKRELAAAESALDQAIKDLNMRERASKEIIGSAMEAAFARLVSARASLIELETLIMDEG